MQQNKLQKILGYFLLTLVLLVSYIVSQTNYLLFHSFAELFSIIISSCIFIIAWILREKTENHFFVFLGIAYLFVGGIDLFHTLSYKGMQIFHSDIFYANQLWIAARFLESISLLIFALFIDKKFKINPHLILFTYFVTTSAILLSIFYFKIFPACFIAGLGQTDFKIFSEYLIVLILFSSFLLLRKKKRYFEKNILLFISLSLITTIISEFLFTLYTDNFGITNVLGHIFKIVSFYLIYKSIIVINIENPFSLIFQQLSNKLEETSRLNIELEKANRTKNKFFSIISHDLKNPIGGLKGVLSLINNDWESFSELQKKEYIKLLFYSSENIADLLDNLLLWAKNQMDKIILHKTKFPIKTLIEKNISLYINIAKTKGIEIVHILTKEIFLYADLNMLDTVIRNLLNNALKFSYPQGKVMIDAEESSDFIRIHIKDEGTGIKKEDMEKLFRIDTFQHTKGTNNEEGTGLGLIICKDFIERNNGKLIVESEENMGSTFTIEFKKPFKTGDISKI